MSVRFAFFEKIYLNALPYEAGAPYIITEPNDVDSIDKLNDWLNPLYAYDAANYPSDNLEHAGRVQIMESYEIKYDETTYNDEARKFFVNNMAWKIFSVLNSDELNQKRVIWKIKPEFEDQVILDYVNRENGPEANFTEGKRGESVNKRKKINFYCRFYVEDVM